MRVSTQLHLLLTALGKWGAARYLAEVEGILASKKIYVHDLLDVRWQSSPCCATSNMHIHGSFIHERNDWISNSLKDTDHRVEMHSYTQVAHKL